MIPRGPRRTLVLGGARSGKSYFAEQSLRRYSAVDYVACGALPGTGDPEWDRRVLLHRARRPAHWTTIETLDVSSALRQAGPPVLVDCVTTWLARTMDDCGLWRLDGPETVAEERLASAIEGLVEGWRRSGRRAVLVSNEVGSSIVPATASGRLFRDELGALNARLAAAADRVWLVTAGIGQRLR